MHGVSHYQWFIILFKQEKKFIRVKQICAVVKFYNASIECVCKQWANIIIAKLNRSIGNIDECLVRFGWFHRISRYIVIYIIIQMTQWQILMEYWIRDIEPNNRVVFGMSSRKPKHIFARMIMISGSMPPWLA